MTEGNDAMYYKRRAAQQLKLAECACDPAIKTIHLNLASRYAIEHELAIQRLPPEKRSEPSLTQAHPND